LLCSPFFEIARVLVRLDHVASVIVVVSNQSYAVDLKILSAPEKPLERSELLHRRPRPKAGRCACG